LVAEFKRYFSVGLLNTGLHWSAFTFLIIVFDASQASSNLIAFVLSVTFSFFANSKWTFKSNATLTRYILFSSFMGALALVTGHIADQNQLPELVTLVAFSGCSLLLGFMYSRFFVFRG